MSTHSSAYVSVRSQEPPNRRDDLGREAFPPLRMQLRVHLVDARTKLGGRRVEGHAHRLQCSDGLHRTRALTLGLGPLA